MTTPEKDRFNAVTEANEVINLILENKTINWTDAKLNSLRASLDQIIDGSALSSLSPAEREQYYEDLFKDPKFSAAIRTRYGEVVATRLTDEVTEAQRKANEAQAKHTAAEAKRGDANDELTRLQGREKSLSPTPPTGDYKVLRDLQKRDLDLEQKDARNELKATQRRYEYLLEQRRNGTGGSTIDADIADAKTARDSANAEANKANADIAKRDDLERETRELPQQLREARRLLAEADQEFNVANEENNTATGKYSSAILERGKQEIQFVQDMQNVARDGVARQLDANMQEVIRANSAKLQTEEAEATDAFEKKLKANQRNRYYKGRTPGRLDPRRSRIEVNGDAAREDVGKLLVVSGKGANQLVEDALERAGLTGDNLIEKMKDRAYVDAMGKELAGQALTVYFQTGGRLRGPEAAYLDAQPWGEGLVVKALSSSKPAQDMDKKLKEAGVNGGIRELMKTKKGKGIIALILALAAGAIIVPTAGALMAAAGIK